MEHLTYPRTEEESRREWEALKGANFAVPDWDAWDAEHGPCPQVEESIEWLGYEHEPLEEDDYDDLWSYVTARAKHDDLSGYWPLMQSWLYVGLLQCFLGRPLSLSAVTRRHPDGRLLVYSRLLCIIARSRFEEQLSLGGGVGERFVEMLHFAIHVNSKTALTSSPESRYTATQPAQIQLFHMLHTTIMTYESLTAGGVERRSDMEPVFRRLRSRGWCGAVLEQVYERRLDTCLRLLDSNGWQSESIGHASCPGATCIKNNLASALPKVNHVSPGCRCSVIAPPWESVKACIVAGLIPVVRLAEDYSEGIIVTGISPTSDSPGYTALSHVWADGLGGCTEQGLPWCQLERLIRLVDSASLSRQAYFWIDSLCVPKERTLRKKALGTMRGIYERAELVLVLDSDIRSYRMRAPWILRAWAVFSSGWAQRLWTYQEGSLARKLVFELSDGLLAFDSLILEQLQHRDWNPPLDWFFSLLEPLAGRIASKQGQTRSYHIESVRRAVAFRSTSKLTDELLVVGGLLGLDVEKLVSLETTDRWKQFYLKLGQIPWTIVFDPAPKLNIDKFRWAPSTLLTQKVDVMVQPKLARCREEGLYLGSTTILRLSEPLTIDYSDPNLFEDSGPHLPQWQSALFSLIWSAEADCWFELGQRRKKGDAGQHELSDLGCHERGSDSIDTILVAHAEPAFEVRKVFTKSAAGTSPERALGMCRVQKDSERVTLRIIAYDGFAIRALSDTFSPDGDSESAVVRRGLKRVEGIFETKEVLIV